MSEISEHWRWIVVPMVIVTAVAVVVYLTMGPGESEFVYPL